MMRIRIDDTLRDQWSPVIARYFQMMLASCATQVRGLAVSFGTEQDVPSRGKAWVCELRGRHHDGREIRIRSAHPDPETAIGHAFARTRREIQRRRLRAGAPVT